MTDDGRRNDWTGVSSGDYLVHLAVRAAAGAGLRRLHGRAHHPAGDPDRRGNPVRAPAFWHAHPWRVLRARLHLVFRVLRPVDHGGCLLADVARRDGRRGPRRHRSDRRHRRDPVRPAHHGRTQPRVWLAAARRGLARPESLRQRRLGAGWDRRHRRDLLAVRRVLVPDPGRDPGLGPAFPRRAEGRHGRAVLVAHHPAPANSPVRGHAPPEPAQSQYGYLGSLFMGVVFSGLDAVHRPSTARC